MSHLGQRSFVCTLGVHFRFVLFLEDSNQGGDLLDDLIFVRPSLELTPSSTLEPTPSPTWSSLFGVGRGVYLPINKTLGVVICTSTKPTKS